jgi:hypothetical protein
MMLLTVLVFVVLAVVSYLMIIWLAKKAQSIIRKHFSGKGVKIVTPDDVLVLMGQLESMHASVMEISVAVVILIETLVGVCIASILAKFFFKVCDLMSVETIGLLLVIGITWPLLALILLVVGSSR